jgi:hypothetical protein
MKDAEAACAMHNNGGCAAFVADAARLGQFDSAWAAMLKNYEAKSNWDYPKKCNVAGAAPGQCPKGQEQSFAKFPDALTWFLTDAGYIKPPAR